jgi:hypothetical protein
MSELFMFDEDVPILVEFEPGPGLRKVAKTDEELEKKSKSVLEAAKNLIYKVGWDMIGVFTSMAQRPDKVEVSFGIKLDGESGAMIAKVGVEGAITVKLTWEKDKS